MPPKRRATSPVRPSPAKKPKPTPNTTTPTTDPAETTEIIQRRFYPREISSARCAQYANAQLPTPHSLLTTALKETQAARDRIKIGECVVHWFKRDLRVADNRALSLAGEKAEREGVPLVGLYVASPEDWEAHCSSAARVDLEMRTLGVLREDLENELGIPLCIVTAEKRGNVEKEVVGRCKEWGAKHVFCNVEYEVDELRRETRLVKTCLEQGVAFMAVHDDCVVPPGELVSKSSGKPFSVFSPFSKAWFNHIEKHPHLLALSPLPPPNPPSAREKFSHLFNTPLPPVPASKTLPPEDQARLASYWPAGEHEAQNRLAHFLETKIRSYKTTRNYPAKHSTSLLSPHLALGALSARTAVRGARELPSQPPDPSEGDAGDDSEAENGGEDGITTWITELAWRDFYKHVLVHWPYVCMSKGFKYEYSNIEWKYDNDAFNAWCEGKTGFPYIDAAMRQMNAMGWMHNRARMAVASFLAKDLLLDWRMGEKFFMEKLVDGDWASNNGGWGFSSSVGVDPQPYFRIFNPTLQGEKFDAEGAFIRKWVPELRGVEGKAVHDPYARGKGKEAERTGYPKPMVDHKAARVKALEVYKAGLGRSTANVGGGVHN